MDRNQWIRMHANAADALTGKAAKVSDMGPPVTKGHRDKVASYIDAYEADGAKIVLAMPTLLADGGVEGFWLGPTLLDKVLPHR